VAMAVKMSALRLQTLPLPPGQRVQVNGLMGL
jgi:hypothetical protein